MATSRRTGNVSREARVNCIHAMSPSPEIGYCWIVTRNNLAAALLVTALCFSQQGSDPWIKAELIEPASFAQTLRSGSGKPDKITSTTARSR